MKRKTINFAHEFFLIDAEYNKVGSFFSARILTCANFVAPKCRKSHGETADGDICLNAGASGFLKPLNCRFLGDFV